MNNVQLIFLILREVVGFISRLLIVLIPFYIIAAIGLFLGRSMRNIAGGPWWIVPLAMIAAFAAIISEFGGNGPPQGRQ